MAEQDRVRWVLSPLTSGASESGSESRPTSPSDDPALARLLDHAYRESIDFDPDADHLEELSTWRTHDGADDAASFVATRGGQVVGAALVGRELGAPFLYEIAVDPLWRGRGIAESLLRSSLAVLETRGEDAIACWVTSGNVASESLLARTGFVPVTPPVGRSIGLRYYRGAAVVDSLNLPPSAVVAVSVTDEGATVWVVGAPGRGHTAAVAGTAVQVEFLDEDDSRLPDVARASMPLRGISRLLALRTD